MSRATRHGAWRRVVIIWVCAAAMIGAWTFVRHRSTVGASTTDAAAAAHPGGRVPVFERGALPIERIDRIDFRHRSTAMVFERRDDGWHQREPFDQLADGAQLRDLLVRAADLRASRSTPAGSVDLAALGLDPPQAVLTLAFGDVSRRLQLGRRGVGGRAWLRVDDGPALAVDPLLHDALLEGDPRRWRSWRLFEQVGTESDRLTFDRTPTEPGRPPVRFELEKRGGRWWMTEPFHTRVDQATVEALLAALARVEHAGFADDAPVDLALYGLERPIASVEVRSTRRRPNSGAEPVPSIERLEIGSALAQGGAICARRVDRPPIMLLEQAALAALVPSPAAFVDPRPSGVLPEDIRAMHIRDANGATIVELERSLDGWRLVDADGSRRAARADAVGLLFERLCVSRAPELALQPMPAELLVATIELVPSVGATTTVRIGREGANGKWAIDESDDVLRVFPPSLEIPLSLAAFAGPVAAPDASSAGPQR